MLGRRICIVVFLALASGRMFGPRQRVDEPVSSLSRCTYEQQCSVPQPVPAADLPLPLRSFKQSHPADNLRPAEGEIRQAAWLEPVPSRDSAPEKQTPQATIPEEIPGAEASVLTLPRDRDSRQHEVERLFPPLPPLPPIPVPLPGPSGQPYTLADFQQIAAANSPQLRQAAADVEAARGNQIQAGAYPNPTVSLQAQPSNDGSTPGADGFGIDQTIKTAGKLRLQSAAAEMDFHNAELALRRAQSSLATQVRNAWFALLVAKEAVQVSRALSQFTDAMYRIQAGLLAGGFAAPYEPAALRAQAFSAQLAYRQALQTYLYAWKQLVAAVNVRQLPLSEIAGRADQAIPYYDFDAVQAYVLCNHTDVLTARIGIEKARYNLKLAQVTPIPDVDVNVAVIKDYSLAPHQTTPTLTLGMPIPVWDRNRGGIMAAEAALVRANEEPHRVEVTLAGSLATAYMNYKTSIDALEYYRRYILPDQVRAYRGAYDRRQIDPNASFGDVVTAQQTLAANVTTYLQTLGQVWTSVVAVADLIQTDDLFACARPETVPPLPDLSALPGWPCCHPCEASPCDMMPAVSPAGSTNDPAISAPRESVPAPVPVPQANVRPPVHPAEAPGIPRRAGE